MNMDIPRSTSPGPFSASPFKPLWFAILLLAPLQGFAQEAGTGPKTNLAIIRDLTEAIGQRIGYSAGTPVLDTISVTVRPRETSWYVEASLLKGIAGTGRGVRLSSEGTVTALCGVEEIVVSYTDPRAEGLLGATIVDRQVSVTVSSMVVRRASGEILLNEELLEERTDTIELGYVTELENPNIPATQGSLPTEGFFSNIGGPLILIGAIGVAVFLLFHVRS